MSNRLFVRIGATLCFLAVALGAFGAHALRDLLAFHNTAEVWKTAVTYQFLHALAVFAIGMVGANRRAPAWLFVTGTLLFSGSLYVLALTSVRHVGLLTPLGGLCFLAGWAWLVATGGR